MDTTGFQYQYTHRLASACRENLRGSHCRCGVRHQQHLIFSVGFGSTCIVLSVERITHRAPTGTTVGIEIPMKVKQAIGLEEAPSWVIVSEHNVDEWPNGGLSAVPGEGDAFAYGFLPPGLFSKVKAAFLVLARNKKTGAVRR